MVDNEFTLPSGAKLLVGLAPFVDAKRLHDKILRSLVGKGVGGLDLKALRDINTAGSVVMDALMQVASDTDVENAIFECAKRSLYSHDGNDGTRIKVDRILFDDPVAGEKARGDFYAICFKIMEVNLKPFLMAITSLLQTQPEMIAAFQELKSKQTKP